jgi:CBS domain containing-hemolysin-like protein
MTTLVIFILLFLILSAFFSGAEIAFISANKLSIEVEKDKGTRVGSVLARFYNEPREFLSALLVGNNIALVILTTLMTRMLDPLISTFATGGWLLFINTLIITAVVLIFGEYLPKVFCRLYANEVIHAFAFPLAAMKWLLAAPTWMMTKLSNFSLKYIFRTQISDDEDAITRLDLQDFVEGTSAPVQSEIETDMFKNALHLKEVRLKDCMIPRPEIIHIDMHAPIDELVLLFRESRHSRILVTEGDLDHVLGYVHHQQLINPVESINSILFSIPFVPETMSAKDLMLNLIKDENSIACVVDEFGGTAGIATLEDILEEIFGEIEDEHDEEDFIEEKIGNDEYLFSGRLEIDYLNEKYPELKLPDGDHHTLSGYIVMTSGTIPDEGDAIILGDYRFICEAVTDKKVETIRVIRNND